MPAGGPYTLVARSDGETQEISGHHCYRYKGYSVCLSYPHGDFICILVSRRPMKEFMQDIADSEP